MKKKTVMYISIFILVPILLFTGLYIGLAYYYSDGFCYGTWVNGVYCTGKSIAVVNDELLATVSYDELTLIDKSGTCYSLPIDDLDYTFDFNKPLQKLMDKQVPILWGQYYLNPIYHQLQADVTYNEEVLVGFLQTSIYETNELYNEENQIQYEKTVNGYVLIDKTKDLLIPERVEEVVKQALLDGETTVDLYESNCYSSLEETDHDKQVLEEWNKISDFQDFTLTYSMGDTEEIVDASVVSNWIQTDFRGNFIFDDNGNLQLDEAKVMDYVVSLGEKYDTLNKSREFQSTRGDIVTIEGGTYGNDIDEEAESQLLIEDFRNNRTGEKREPVYANKALYQGTDDIGGTYIEVDMTEQVLYYYVDYEIKLETPVVTGNMRRGFDTPAKVCYVYAMQRNRTLRGDGYATFVYYWMAVYGNIGLHDATWRDEFGGDIYQTDGSHGCVNMPKDKAAELYDMLEKGTPVILFY